MIRVWIACIVLLVTVVDMHRYRWARCWGCGEWTRHDTNHATPPTCGFCDGTWEVV
jgi:hypothetical protein